MRRDTLDSKEQEFYESLYTESRIQFDTWVTSIPAVLLHHTSSMPFCAVVAFDRLCYLLDVMQNEVGGTMHHEQKSPLVD